MPKTQIKNTLLLLSIMIAARVLFILLMPHTYSYDLQSWLKVMDVLDKGGNPYGVTTWLNWPPFWMQILFGIHKLAQATGLNPITGIQITLISCEALVLILSYHISLRYFNSKQSFRAILFGLALNPVCILLSCQHCNYDVFVGFWILLSIWMLIEYNQTQQRDSWLMACFFLGMGILSKTIPVMLVPLLLAGIRHLNWRSRIFGLLLLGAPVIIGMSVLYTLEPVGVMKNVIGYRSLSGWYGIHGLLNIFNAHDAQVFYQSLSPFLFIAVLLFTTWKCLKVDILSPSQLVIMALTILIFIPTFGPGYSPPYILWFLPLAVLTYTIGRHRFRIFLLVGLMLSILTYAAEYSIFNSHGSLLQAWYPGDAMERFCDHLSDRKAQTIIRLPLFVYYLVLFGKLNMSHRKWAISHRL